MTPLEKQYTRLETIPKEINYILLLGGERDYRAWEALRLYHQIPNVKIITSGYSFYDSISNAEKTAKLLVESGVKKENILMQKEAKDTYEEALMMKKRVGNNPFILVTSAYHMPRAMMLFQKEGLNPIAAPTDFNPPNETGVSTTFQGRELRKTEKALHEYLGVLWTQLKN